MKKPKPPRTDLDDFIWQNFKYLYKQKRSENTLGEMSSPDKNKGGTTLPPHKVKDGPNKGAGIWVRGQWKGYWIFIRYDYARDHYGSKWVELDCNPPPSQNDLDDLEELVTLGNLFHEFVHMVYTDGICNMVDKEDPISKKIVRVEDPKCVARVECEATRIAAYIFDMIARLDPGVPTVRPPETAKCTLGYWFWKYADDVNEYSKGNCKNAGL